MEKQFKFWTKVTFMASFIVTTMSCKKSEETRPPSNIAANRELARSFYEDGFNSPSDQDKEKAILKVVSTNYIQHNSLVPPGRDGLLAFDKSLGLSFSNFKVVVRDIFASEDRVVSRSTFSGVLSGQPFLGIAATGQKFDFDVIDIWTIKDGQLFEHWDEIDWTRALPQFGATQIPAPFIALSTRPANR